MTPVPATTVGGRSQEAHWRAALEDCQTPAELERLRLRIFGRKGELTAALKTLSTLPLKECRQQGQELNRIKAELTAAFVARKHLLDQRAQAQQRALEKADVTLPALPHAQGLLHPIAQTIEEIVTFFSGLGFTLAEGPHIEDEEHNFTALNIPPEHPARQDHDTFYLRPEVADGERLLLRTHTSPVQVRALRSQSPPLRIIAPGRTFRCDNDATHAPMFHQVEGMVVDETVTFSHLKGTLTTFCRALFGMTDLPVRFRPSYFPFTEPSAEVDIGCSHRDGRLVIGGGGWLEILGCGMIHPQVLEHNGLDPDRVQGFAFGAGIERIAMLKLGINDLRSFFHGDRPWLQHYGFLPSATVTLGET